MRKPQQKKSPEFKLKLAIEALKGEKSVLKIASDNGIHPKQVQRWRDRLMEEGEEIFIHKATQKSTDPDKEKLLHIIDQLSLELEFLKKKLRRND